MAQFSLWPDMPADDARRRHVVTLETLLEIQAFQAPTMIALTGVDILLLNLNDFNINTDLGILLLPDTAGVTRCYKLGDKIERWGEAVDTLYLFVLTPIEECV
jgi:hypothetical protein